MSIDKVITNYIASLHKRGKKIYIQNKSIQELVNVVKHPVLSEYLKPKLKDKEGFMEALMMLRTAYLITDKFEEEVGEEINGYELCAIIKDILENSETRQAIAQATINDSNETLLVTDHQTTDSLPCDVLDEEVDLNDP
jgi:predicted transcriptional regulator